MNLDSLDLLRLIDRASMIFERSEHLDELWEMFNQQRRDIYFTWIVKNSIDARGLNKFIGGRINEIWLSNFTRIFGIVFSFIEYRVDI